MPAVQPPALWLSLAATAVSVVTVAAMASSGGLRRPLTFAGAVLLPGDQPSVAAPAASDTARGSRQLSRPSPSRTRTPTSAVPSAAGTAGYAASTPVIVPIQNASSTPTPTTDPSSPAATAAPASRPPAQPHAPHPSASGPPDTGTNATALAQALFTALNQTRLQVGLPALRWSDRLQRSAADHNQQMARANELTSRVGDEPALGVRQANQGVLGSYAAENVASTQATGLAGALAAHQSMLAEQPLDGARRQNLLSTALNAVGIDVLLDPAHGRMWITQDFAQLP